MAPLVKTWPAKAGERCNNLKKGKMSFSPQCSPRSSVSFTVWWERSGVCLVIVHFQTRLSAVCSCLEMELPFIQFIYKLPIWKTQQWPQDSNKSVFIPIPKKGNAKEYSNYHTIAAFSFASKSTPVFLPGESQGQRSLVGCHLWGCTESDKTEAT